MDQSFLNKVILAHQGCNDCPKSEEISSFFNRLLGLLFPNFSNESIKEVELLKARFEQLREEFSQLLTGQLHLNKDQTVIQFFDMIPTVYELLLKDIHAICEGDPAAHDEEEVVRSYPGFYAIAAYRFAHALLDLQVKVIPRSITEHAHGKTGIDIHPAAEIGEYFCIDHGTGVVIGETTHIGDYVKIYQGVTLGALSVDKSMANTKRHPTIEDHVVIYSGATILGGNTIVGEGSVIGGNVWITKSIPPGAKVYYQAHLDENGYQSSSEPVLINQPSK